MECAQCLTLNKKRTSSDRLARPKIPITPSRPPVTRVLSRKQRSHTESLCRLIVWRRSQLEAVFSQTLALVS